MKKFNLTGNRFGCLPTFISFMICTMFLMPLCQTMAQPKVVINEVMQSNVDFMMLDHDFPDSWVELYNGSDTRIQVNNYRIGTTNVFSEGMRLSNTVTYIEPGGHLVLYCDKTTAAPFHYNFNLEAGNGQLFLFANDGMLIDSLYYDEMPAPNVAFGRITDGSDEWQYELSPTPGAANSSVGSSELLPEPLFSNMGHVMVNGPETVTVSMPDGLPEDTRIFLTLDGSEPTWESASATQFEFSIDKSTVVRAKLLSHQMLPIRSTTHSYIFHPRETTLPIVSIATDSTYLYSSEEGILSNDSTDGMPNYSYDWRRPANFEYFSTTDGATVFNQSGELAVSGGVTRSMPQKSIKCYAKKRFGKKNFKGHFWRDKPEVVKVKSFTLRNGGNNCKAARINDAALQKFFGTKLEEIDWQAYEPVIVYINGVYKGVYGFRERSNEDYVTSNYNVDEDDVEIATASNYLKGTVKDTPHFNAFHALYNRADVTYEELSEVMNVESFMNAFIAECYSSNTDFPQNNVSIWKQTDTESQWHWILKDLDFVSSRDVSWNMFKYMLGTKDSTDAEYALSVRTKTVTARTLYERMMSFPEFRDRFIAAYATYLGDILRPDVCLPIVRQMDDEILDEIAPTFAAYDNMSTLKKHNTYVEKFCDYITQRPGIVYLQMADYFQLGETIPVTVVSNDTEDYENGGGNVSLCGVPLRTEMFNGAWFSSFPLLLKTDADNAAWTMTVTHADGSESAYVYDTPQIKPDLTSCVAGDSITFMITDVSAVTAITDSHLNESRSVKAIYDVTGKKLPKIQKGLNIIYCSDGTRRIIFKTK